MKRILLVTDVYGWGGHVRAEYIKKYLSDEFDFDIMDGEEFQEYYKNISTSIKTYNLIYILFHTMLLRKDVMTMLEMNCFRFISIATGIKVLRSGFSGKKALQNFLVRANNCVSIGANNKTCLRDLESIYDGKTFYAPRGVDPEVFYPKREFKEKPEKEFTACYVGKPVEEKGLFDIIKPACAEANINLITNTRNYTDALSPEEMNDFYNQADVYIVASTIDGTPNPALEAASCGLPILSNHIGNMPDLIDNNKNSWIVERNVHDYVKKLNWMKTHQRTTWETGQKIREVILNEWTWDRVLNKNERVVFRGI